MKNNTLHIVRKHSKHGEEDYRPHLYYETFKATSYEGVKRILGKRNKKNIAKAIYTNTNGTSRKIQA